VIEIRLQRDIRDERVTMGRLFLVDGDREQAWLYTLENPWLNNQPNISCIPAGRYICRRIISPTYGETFEVTDVHGRTHILFHWGNYVGNTMGCILLGTTRDPAVPAVWNSRTAHTEFMDELYGVEQFPIEIVDEDYQEAA
jgi:hypothetical protein